MASDSRSYPLPDDPALADVALTMRNDRSWGQVFDASWNVVYVTDDLRRTFGGGQLADFAIGAHMFGPEMTAASRRWPYGANSPELLRAQFALMGGLALADTPGGRDELRERVDPLYQDMIDDLEPCSAVSLGGEVGGLGITSAVRVSTVAVRIRDEFGRLAGTATWAKPAAGMDIISALISNADPDHLERMQVVAKAARRPAAILFADIEGSTSLSRRLSTASYFTLARRLVRAADRCVIAGGGLVGRHVGDGIVAFFLAETMGSESSAARACITAMRDLRTAIGDIAVASDIDADDLILRFGLHWGSTLYVGSINTSGRSEVTALGDEVNESARIEACATGGRTLASKSLIERLDDDDAAALGIELDRVGYAILADLPTASEKARRDAPAIAVCEL